MSVCLCRHHVCLPLQTSRLFASADIMSVYLCRHHVCLPLQTSCLFTSADIMSVCLCRHHVCLSAHVWPHISITPCEWILNCILNLQLSLQQKPKSYISHMSAEYYVLRQTLLHGFPIIRKMTYILTTCLAWHPTAKKYTVVSCLMWEAKRIQVFWNVQLCHREPVQWNSLVYWEALNVSNTAVRASNSACGRAGTHPKGSLMDCSSPLKIEI